MKRQNKQCKSLPEWNIFKAHGLVLFISDELKQWNSIISSLTKEQYKQGQRLPQWNTFKALLYCKGKHSSLFVLFFSDE